MDVRRNGRSESLFQQTALRLIVIVAVSITACARARADTDEPAEEASAAVEVESASIDVADPSNAHSANRPVYWTSPECGGDAFLPASTEFSNCYVQHRAHRPHRGFLAALLSGLSILLLVFVWRRPAGAASKHDAAPPTPSPRDIVCLSCSRCGRVIDVRRDCLSRQLFCPRCGATMPRDV